MEHAREEILDRFEAHSFEWVIHAQSGVYQNIYKTYNT